MGDTDIYDQYNEYNLTKKDQLDNYNNIYNTVNNKLDKIISHTTMESESASLLLREKNLFIINSVITIGLFITIFKVL